jgi:hypothetical protein
MFASKRITIPFSAVTLFLMSTAMALAQVQVYRPVRPAAVARTVPAQTSVESESTSPAGKYYKVSVNGGTAGRSQDCLSPSPRGALPSDRRAKRERRGAARRATARRPTPPAPRSRKEDRAS